MYPSLLDTLIQADLHTAAGKDDVWQNGMDNIDAYCLVLGLILPLALKSWFSSCQESHNNTTTDSFWYSIAFANYLALSTICRHIVVSVTAWILSLNSEKDTDDTALIRLACYCNLNPFQVFACILAHFSLTNTGNGQRCTLDPEIPDLGPCGSLPFLALCQNLD